MIRKRRLLYGVGINDADYVTQKHENIILNGKCVQKLVWTCPFYLKWKDMLKRCYASNKQKENPTYKDCSVCEEWLTFSSFKAWMETQDWEGMQLDKDLLVRGNKLYSPETCVFISQMVNKFIIECDASRGDWPLGVYWNKRDKKFVARCCNPFTGKRDSLGNFCSPEEAHQAWLAHKKKLAIQLSAVQDNPAVARVIIERYANYNK